MAYTYRRMRMFLFALRVAKKGVKHRMTNPFQIAEILLRWVDGSLIYYI